VAEAGREPNSTSAQADVLLRRHTPLRWLFQEDRNGSVVGRSEQGL